MKNNKRLFRLTLTETQYQDVITAVETFHRIICGQVEQITLANDFKVSDDTLGRLKEEMFPELHRNSSYSWDGGHPDKYIDRLQASTYQIYREMLHVRTVDDADKDWSVYRSETLNTKKAERPKIEVIHLNNKTK